MSEESYWICPDCETRNSAETTLCAVCGCQRESEDECNVENDPGGEELSFSSAVSSVTFSVSTGEKSTLSSTGEKEIIVSESALSAVSSAKSVEKRSGCLSMTLTALALALGGVCWLLTLCF